MSQCSWDPSKHGGKPCPVHGTGGNSGSSGHKIRINNGKYEMKLSDDSDWEEISSEEYNDLREGGYQDFDETVDDDFGFDEDEDEYQEYIDKVNEDLEKVTDKKSAEYVADEIDNLTEAGYISEEMSDKLYAELDKKIDEYVAGMPLYNSKISDKKSPEEKLMGEKSIRDAVIDDTLKDTNVNKEAIKSLADKEYESEADEYKVDKNGNKYLEFNSDKEAKEYFNSNDLPDGTVMYGNKIYLGKPDATHNKKYSYSDMEKIYGKDFENKSKEFNQKDYKYNPEDDTYSERNSNQSKEESSEKRWNNYKEKGKSTWNKKLNKGDKVTFKDRDGNDMEAYIGGFYFKGDLQDEDTYEEGKDNLWHDFRGLQLVDENGKEVGNINANQIIKHESKSNTENEKGQENTFSNSKEVRDWVKEYLAKQGLGEDFVQKTLKMMDDNQNVSDYYYELMKKLQGK